MAGVQCNVFSYLPNLDARKPFGHFVHAVLGLFEPVEKLLLGLCPTALARAQGPLERGRAAVLAETLWARARRLLPRR